jgi:RNA polymerase sigma-70 factor, ECF subfamily
MPVSHWTGTVSDIPVDERMLLARVAAGDRSALASLYRRYYRRLTGFLRFSLEYSDDVEDIVNNTFAEIWRGARTSSEASPAVSTWVFGIAYREASQYLGRRRRPAARRDATIAADPFMDAVNEPEHRDALRRVLGALSFEQRTTLVLAYQVGCAIEEIAVITGVPVGSVSARMLCARIRLRDVSRAAVGRRSGAWGAAWSGSAHRFDGGGENVPHAAFGADE